MIPIHFLFADGVQPRVDSLAMKGTYSGLMEGYPCKLINESMILPACLGFAKRLNLSVKPHILEAPITRSGQEHGFGPEESLPAMFFAVTLTESHFGAPRPDGCDMSSAVLGWFQETPAPPVDPRIIEQVRALRWEDIATFYEY